MLSIIFKLKIKQNTNYCPKLVSFVVPHKMTLQSDIIPTVVYKRGCTIQGIFKVKADLLKHNGLTVAGDGFGKSSSLEQFISL